MLFRSTNDGDLAQRLAHPSHGVEKTYVAEVEGRFTREASKQLLAGVELEDGPARVDSVNVLQSLPQRALVEITLHEGRKHIVRRILEHVGHPVTSLVRVKVGPIRLGQQRPGTVRVLGGAELSSLYTAAGL